MADLAAIAGQAAIGAFQQTFDPHGSKRQAVEHEDSAEKRRADRHEQELSLKEQQIRQAKIKTALDEDNKKNAEMMNKFMMSNQDPGVAAEMYNSMPFEDEYKFNKQKWTSTANGGRRDTPMATSTRAGADGALKPNEENTDAQMLGPDDGPIQFLRGYYKRDDKGQKILGDDGQPIFVETDTPVNYANKKAMNDAVSRMQDPKLRVAMTLKELGIDEFFSKEKGRRESSKQEHARSMELQDKKNKGNLAVAEMQAKGSLANRGHKPDRTASYENPFTGKTDELNDSESRALAANAKTYSNRVSKALSDDPEFAKGDETLFSQDEAYSIQTFLRMPIAKKTKSYIEKVKSLEDLDGTVADLIKEGVPEKYAEFMVSKRRKELTTED
jgi:hypothetical protein